MKEYGKKLSIEDIENMRKEKLLGATSRSLAFKYNISMSTVNYHTNEEAKEKMKQRTMKYLQRPDVKEKDRKSKMKYMQSPKGRRSIARSWIRVYLRKGIITKEDVMDILEEFK